MSPHRSPQSPFDSESRPLLDNNDRASSYNTLIDSDSYVSSDGTVDQSAIAPANKHTRSELIWILAGLWSAVFLGALDGVFTSGTVVATLLAPIGSQFNRSNQSSYIGTSYLLSVCCFTPLYGRLSDILGRKGAMLLALSLFGLGTVMCGLAPSMNTLLVARAIAGMGGGGVMTVSSVTVTDLIPLKQRGLYQGMANILYGMGSGLGGPVGGWISDNFGWYADFLHIPILIFSIVLVAWKVNIVLPYEVQNQSLADKLRRIDIFGSLTLVTTVGCLLLGFSLKTMEEIPWSHPLIWGLFVASVVFGVLFVLVEKHWAPYPVMPLRLMVQRTPLAVCIANFVSSATAFSMVSLDLFALYHIPLYFIAVKLNSASTSGLHLLPHSFAISTGSVFAGWVMRRTGKLYTLTLISAGGCVLANILVILWNDKTAPWHLWLDIVPQGFGMASLITSTLIAVIAGVYQEDMAVATGVTYLFRTTGQVLGVSLGGAILQSVLNNGLRKRIHGPNATHVRMFRSSICISHNTDYVHDLDPILQKAAVDSYADALRIVFVFQLVMAIAGFIACVPIQENHLPCLLLFSSHSHVMLTYSLCRGTHEEQEEHYRNLAELDND
ncbi:MFS general substrate transporter [Fistulina hepatica ATCC 64428]|nr:MFS general substrate transporter [Fistulina hepatica ATCC 64428]